MVEYDPKFETTGPDGKKIKGLAYQRQKYIEAKNKLNHGIDPPAEQDQEMAERKATQFVADFVKDYVKE